MPRWNFGSTGHYFVTSGFVDMRKALLALPELVMETSQEHQGPSDTLSTLELGTKEFTELGRAGGGLGGAQGGTLAALRRHSGLEPSSTGLRVPSLFQTLRSSWSAV